MALVALAIMGSDLLGAVPVRASCNPCPIGLPTWKPRCHQYRRKLFFLSSISVHKCFYRLDVVALLSKKDLARVDSELTSSNYSSAAERYTQVGQVAVSFADRWLGETKSRNVDIGYCAALHSAASSDFTEYEQSLVGDYLKQYLLQKK